MYQNQLYQSPLGCKFMIVILKSWLKFIGPISLVSQTFDKQMSLDMVLYSFLSLWTTSMLWSLWIVLFAGFPWDQY